MKTYKYDSNFVLLWWYQDVHTNNSYQWTRSHAAIRNEYQIEIGIWKLYGNVPFFLTNEEIGDQKSQWFMEVKIVIKS